MDSLVKYVNLLVDILTSPLPPKKRKEKKRKEKKERNDSS